ncbi:MAG: aldehyde dehydrogenase family protein [Bacteroidales bacterium]|nr:aldehyde dehydrogenase family protein [Candidatus Colimorpha onthohippi]
MDSLHIDITDKITTTIQQQRDFFAKGSTLSVKWRIQQLKALKNAIISHEKDLEQALTTDLGRSNVEGYLCDILPTITEINENIRHLRKWSHPEWHYSGLMCFPSISTRVYKMPYGVVLIMSPFNFPVLLTFGVLAACIAGGNTAVIRPSGKSMACTKIICQILAETFPKEYITTVTGGHDVGDLLLQQRFDKIFYTGSPAVARHILEMASHNLTPVTLELGGETGNWCIVRRDADLKDAARKIAFLKSLNAGQICININQIAVAEDVADQFLTLLKEAFNAQLGSTPECNPEYPKLITREAWEKCAALSQQYADKVVYGGTGDAQSQRWAPTILYPVPIDDPIVQQELFSPLLPIVVYPDYEIDRVVDTIASREHPLALYLFTRSKRWAHRMMSTLQFGGGCINEVCVHLMVKGVPFNGTGHSGMGAYHGEWGFREFTHPQTVLQGRQRFNLSLREHPYTGKAGRWKLKILHLIGRF